MKYIYLAIYKGKQVEITNDGGLYKAKVEACKLLKVPKKQQHMVSIMLVAKDGIEIVHKADF